MNQREKVLAGGIVALLGLWGLWQGFAAYNDAYDRREATVLRLDDEAFDQELEAKRARQALQRLEQYQQQSLPSDPDVARSLYADWLKDTIRDAGLELGGVKWASTRPYRDAATALTFTASAEGDPDGVVKLLDAYYRLDALHQLTGLQVRPADETGGRWGVTLTSVALVVEGAARDDGLPETPREPSRLRLEDAEAYVASIVGRNVFASYTPPPPPRPEPREVASKPKPKPPAPPAFDDAKHAQLTGIVETGSRLEAWVRIRTTGETLRLHEGDTLEVGLLKGRVQAVLPREIVVVGADGAAWRASLGDKLRDAQAASAGGES